MATSTLNVGVISASGLKDTELIGKSDPYVVVSVGKEQRKTKPAKEQPETPVWNEELSLPVLDTDTDSDLLVVIRNDDTMGRDEEMGRVEVPLALIHGRSHSASTFPLELKGKPHGGIKLRLSFLGEGPLGKKFQGLYMGDNDYGEDHEVHHEGDHEVHHEGDHEEHHHEGEGMKEKFEDKIEGLKEKKHRKKHRGDGDEGSSSSSDDEKDD